MNQLHSLPNLLNDIILCTEDDVILYPNIPHDESLSALLKRLDPNSFDRRCNDLTKWLIEKGYDEGEVPKKNFKGKRFFKRLPAG